MYVKFNKEHPAGISKGHCSVVAEIAGKHFIESNYAEEITKEEYESWLESYNKDKQSEAKKAEKSANKSNSKRHQGNIDPRTLDDNEEEQDNDEGNEEASKLDGGDSEENSENGSDGPENTGESEE